MRYGYTDECQTCTQLASGMHNAKVPHDERCRDRIGNLMAEDDDLRQIERVSGTLRLEVAIPRPEVGEEMDVGEPTVDLPQRVQQPLKLKWVDKMKGEKMPFEIGLSGDQKGQGQR